MALNKQIYFYGIETDAFYTAEEQQIADNLRVLRTELKTLLPPNKKDKKKKIKYKKFDDESERKSAIKDTKKQINEQKKNLVESLNAFQKLNITRELNPSYLKDSKINALFESALVRTLNIPIDTLTTDIFVIKVFYFQVIEDLIHNGFNYNDEHYVLFSASAGQIRKKKCVFIKESVLNSVYRSLSCGLDYDAINSCGGVNVNKFLAYYALNSSATDLWTDFDIDKSIVVDDFETLVNGIVDFIDEPTYKIERKQMNVPVPHTDGCGMMLDFSTRMVRLPWVKGLMGKFPYDKFILEYRDKFCNDSIGIIKDIYGKEYDVIKDDIRFIFTKSQFKMWKYYKSWSDYKDNFKKYNCQACYCKEEADNIPRAKVGYQMIQTLTDMSDEELKKLIKLSVTDIENIGNDYRTMQKILGFREENVHKDYFQKSLLAYPEMMRDKYSRDILRDCKNSLVRNAKAAKFAVNGKYTFVLPDMYAFCEWLFLHIEKPLGILRNGEVSCNLYPDGKELDCLRSPHLYREHCVRRNVVNEETKKWFVDKSIYTSTYDLISKILQFDCDGDTLLVIRDNLFCKIAKRNCKNIVPLYYEMKKAPAQLLNNEVILGGMEAAWKAPDIGLYSNLITKIWNSADTEETKLEVIKLLCMENNFAIDRAKTSYMPNRPTEFKNIVNKYESLSLPHFFLYAKDKDEEKLNPVGDSIVDKLDSFVPDSKIKYNSTIGKFNFRTLLSNGDFEYNEKLYQPIVEEYDKIRIYITYSKNNYIESDTTEDNDGNFGEDYLYKNARQKLLDLPFDKDTIINVLVYFLYNVRKTSKKKILWECFGEEIYQNIQNNLPQNTHICPICGKRFESRDNANTTYCSEKCFIEGKLEYDRNYQKNRKTKCQKP